MKALGGSSFATWGAVLFFSEAETMEKRDSKQTKLLVYSLWS
jgi:hypothetical protein